MMLEEYGTLITWAISQVVVSAGVWGAIRADIRNIHERIGRAEVSNSEAHNRIDRILMHSRHSDG
jgi:hypothetical protein